MVLAHSPRPPPWPRNSEVQPVPTARRPLTRLCVCGLSSHPRLRFCTSYFGFSTTISLPAHNLNQLLPMTRSAEQRARRAYQERERRAAESPASRQARLAPNKAATRRRHQAQNLESSITAKRRNSEKKRERRAAESPASRQARLALDKAATRRRRQALESSITAKRLRASHPLRETYLIVQKLKLQRAWNGEEHVPCRCLVP